MAIWGNHFNHVPGLLHATVDGEAATVACGEEWLGETFLPTVAKRGSAIIKARGDIGCIGCIIVMDYMASRTTALRPVNGPHGDPLRWQLWDLRLGGTPATIENGMPRSSRNRTQRLCQGQDCSQRRRTGG